MVQDDFGNRSRRAAVLRVLGGLVVCAIAIMLEVLFGAPHERQQRNTLQEDTQYGWAIDRFIDPANAIAIPQKTAAKRLVYLSNSHAFTGGHVSHHLQRLLDTVCPSAVEIVELSSAGMFAPEFLQRFVASLSFHPDGVILAPGYISFSDRMGLARQASTARSMFKPDVFGRLPLGFWLRNYDFGTYTDSFIAQYWKTYRYRNALRDAWEQPVVSLFNRLTYQGRLFFLDVDEFQGWRFPDGFDRNLFQWRLYTSGRKHHLSDMAALLRLAARRHIPVYGFNLPVHWEKSVYPHNPDDVDQYRRELARIFEAAHVYVDYEDHFPKTFTTYDAMHPNWYGARLHALDIALRLFYHQQLDCQTSAEQIFEQFHHLGQAIGDGYQQAFRQIPVKPFQGFLRLDVTEADNIPKILSRLMATEVTSSKEKDLLLRLSLRLRYWLEMPFEVPENPGIEPQTLWQQAVRTEIQRARARTRYFAERLAFLQQGRLKRFPLPQIHRQDLRRTGRYRIGKREFRLHVYQGAKGTSVVEISTLQGKPFLYKVLDGQKHGNNLLYGDGRGYERIDLLGDGSFILARPIDKGVYIPHWVRYKEPVVGFGI